PSGSQRAFKSDEADRDLLVIKGASLLQQPGLETALDALKKSASLATELAEELGTEVNAGIQIDPTEITRKDLDFWVKHTGNSDQYLLLEIPLGTGTIPLLERYEDALAQPQVGVVITAEGQDQVDVTKFNNAVVFLRQFVRENHIPQKPL